MSRDVKYTAKYAWPHMHDNTGQFPATHASKDFTVSIQRVDTKQLSVQVISTSYAQRLLWSTAICRCFSFQHVPVYVPRKHTHIYLRISL